MESSSCCSTTNPNYNSNKTENTKESLLERWKAIEDHDDDDDDDLLHFQNLKESWFNDAYDYLISLPRDRDNHIWCAYWEIMGPLLETFYHFHNSPPLKLLWERVSEELRECMMCISYHHQAKDTYAADYDFASIAPLLRLLQTLDEERVTNQLKRFNSCPIKDNVDDDAKLITLMYEVLMFPALLDDQLLVNEFQMFMEAVDNILQLALDGHQHYPGVYVLLFFKTRKCRSIGFRLASSIGKLRNAADLDSLQPLLKKCIQFLETDVVPSSIETSRPRMQLDRMTVWLGIKALLGFLEPRAFEEGILEQYPSFLSIVLNHISDDSAEFSHAINCLRLLFDMLGCKLWFRATLSPTVMRDTLLGQCFHTKDEKSHKEIFDLFQPFLQSLEALQDGEHQKQRRHFLYFLLHQVTVSSNFSTLMRKKACQIALLIVHRGYQMNPPSPPFECAHMWGPSLVASLKDSTLYSALRQPAFDLIQTIIVSDASALVSSILHCQIHKSVNRNIIDFKDEDDYEGLFSDDIEKDTSCWNEFSLQSRSTSSVFGMWMCIPMLWVDVLVEIDPTVLPVSFSKAVLWALSRFSMVEPEISSEMALPIGQWLTTRAPELSHLFGWKKPSGFDDGGNGQQVKNSVMVTTMCTPLIRTFRRLTSCFITKVEQSELQKQWTWEPRMAESLILLLVDPDENARQVGRRFVEQFANTRGLLSCLQYLCSCSASVSAVSLGLRHARELLLLDSVLERFQSVQHFFFVLCKLLTEGLQSGQSDDNSNSKFSSQGGFLRQPTFDSMTTDIDGNSSKFGSAHLKKFSFFVSEVAWPCFCICLSEGKAFIDHKISQMTCIRLLECLPAVLQKLQQSMHKIPGDSEILVKKSISCKWLQDLMYWGKSTLAVVVRYWKQTVLSLLDRLKESCDDKTSAILAIEKLIQSENIVIDELSNQVSRLLVSLKNDVNVPYNSYGKETVEASLLQTDGLLHDKESCTDNLEALALEDSDLEILDPAPGPNTERESVIVLSDDEIDVRDDVEIVSVSHRGSSHSSLNGEDIALDTAERASHSNEAMKIPSVANDTIGSVETESNVDRVKPSFVVKGKSVQGTSKEKSSDVQKKSSKMDNSQRASSLKNISNDFRSLNKVIKKPVLAKSDRGVIKEIVFDAKDDPWESALKSARHHQSNLTKLSTGGPKRQVIQLNLPVKNSHSNRLHAGHQRFKPVRLDDWFRPILEMDYFATVGLASSVEQKNNSTIGKLKEVPIYFQSPDDYVAVFRPLVLEELKAQLHNSYVEMGSSDEMSCGRLSVMSVERVDDFHVVRCVHDDKDLEGSKTTCVENDLILLTRQPFQNSHHDVHMVGKIERCEKENRRKSNILMIKLYLLNGCSRLNRAKKLLMERSKWYIHRIMSITSQLREFQALSSIHSNPLLPVILNPNNHQPNALKSRTDLSKLSRPLQQILESSFNDRQLQAISGVSLRNDHDLSLIQGPPGTGKTRTIVAIVSALLSLAGINAAARRPSNPSTPLNRVQQMSQSAAVARAWQDAALAKELKDDDSRATTSHVRGRVLICAQSNAAVDELVSRISSDGLYGSDGSMYKPYLVRVGNAKTVHSNSLPFFIDTLVDHRLNEEEKASDMDVGDSSLVLRSKLEKLVNHIRFLEAKRANLGNGSPDSKHALQGDATVGGDDDMKEMSDAEIGARLKTLHSEKKAVYTELTIAQEREKKAYEKRKALKQKLRKSILREAEVVITTLSGCGGDLYAVCSESMATHKFSASSESSLFDAVVIDEAAQALEPATLIPLQLLKSKGSKSIMVGDPKQLPATVLSDVASKYLYQCSMFERLQKAGHPVTMLTQQYRMHPEISRFPSLHFYDGNLVNGDGMSSKEKPFHKTEGLGPYLFFDIADGKESHGKNSGSLYNECEAEAAVELVRFFRKSYPSEFIGGRIGIITPYRSQLSILRSRFSAAFGSYVMDEMELNTVDGFQGREVDILVVSTVRAGGTEEMNSRKSIGFVADVRRMNVALTRAKHSLWILGNVRTLQTNKNWGALVNDAKDRNLVLSVKKPYVSIFNSLYTKINRVSDENTRHVKRKIGNELPEQGIRFTTSESKRGYPGHGNSSHIRDTKKKAKMQHDSSTKRGPESDCIDKTFQDAKPVTDENGHDSLSHKRDKKKKAKMPHDSSTTRGQESDYIDKTCRDAKPVTDENGHDSLSHIRDKKKKTKTLYDSSTKRGQESVSINKTFDDAKPVTDEHRHDSMSHIRDKKKKAKMQNDSSTKSLQDINKTSKDAKPVTDEHCQGERQSSVDKNTNVADKPLNETITREKKTGSKSSSQVDDPVRKRKQQREAVDALLPSAFISTKKKPESSSKFVPDRRRSSSVIEIRPAKSRKG